MLKNIFLISNIYPTKEKPYRGSFVKNIYEILEESKISVRKIVLEDNTKSRVIKFFDYLEFYFCILFFSITSSATLYVHYISHSALPIWILMFFLKKNVIVNVHGSDVLSESKHNIIIQPFINYILHNCNGIVVPSSYFKNVLIAKYKLRDHFKFHISPSGGIDQSFLNSYKNPKKTDDLTLGFVSRIEEKKGWKLYLDSLFHLKEKGISVRGIMIGTGTDSNKCSTFIHKLGLKQNVEFYPGVDQNQLPEFYRRFDLFIFPTFFNESLGLVALEAMAMGIPVVASNKGAVPEYLLDGENGYLFSPGNLDELVEKILQYSELDLPERNKLSISAMETASRYTNSEIKEDLVNFLYSKI